MFGKTWLNPKIDTAMLTKIQPPYTLVYFGIIWDFIGHFIDKNLTEIGTTFWMKNLKKLVRWC